MTKLPETPRFPWRNDRKVRRLLHATCLATVVAFGIGFPEVNAQPVQSQALSTVDTSKLPRPAGSRALAAIPQTTILLSAEPVPAATQSALAQLEAAGWQRYATPFSQSALLADTESHQLKKGPHALTLFVQVARAQNGATSISYAALPLDRDLPFPAKAKDIRFSPERLHLDAVAPQTHESLLAFYRTELPALGWTLHSSSDDSARMQVPTGSGMQHAFFTHPTHGALHVTVRAVEGEHSSVAVRSVPASVLPGAQAARPPAPVPEPASAPPNPQATAHAQMSQQMNTMAQDLMKQAMQAPPKPGGLDAALAAARNAGVRLDAPGAGRQPAAAAGAATAAASPEPALVREEYGGFPIPKGSTSKSQEKTQWRTEIRVDVRASSASIVDFYNRELGALGWRATSAPQTQGSRTVVQYTSGDGPAVLTVEGRGRETTISLLLRKEAEARKSGMMPKAGQARIMFGNTVDTDTTVQVGGRTLRVAAGAGSKAPDGPSLELPPGTHKVTIKSAGKPDVTEVVTVRADEIWGLLLGPGGALPLPMY